MSNREGLRANMNHPYQTPFQLITLAGEVADGPDGTLITSPPGSVGEVTDSQSSTTGTLYMAKFPAKEPADGDAEVYLYEWEVDDPNLYTRINTKFCPSCGSHNIEPMNDSEGFWGCDDCDIEYLPTHPENQHRPTEDGVTTTTLVAAAWEWICPHCEKYQRAIEAGTSVECVKCGRVYEVEIAE